LIVNLKLVRLAWRILQSTIINFQGSFAEGEAESPTAGDPKNLMRIMPTQGEKNTFEPFRLLLQSGGFRF
jgi:hypothetical protein